MNDGLSRSGFVYTSASRAGDTGRKDKNTSLGDLLDEHFDSQDKSHPLHGLFTTVKANSDGHRLLLLAASNVKDGNIASVSLSDDEEYGWTKECMFKALRALSGGRMYSDTSETAIFQSTSFDGMQVTLRFNDSLDMPSICSYIQSKKESVSLDRLIEVSDADEDKIGF